MPLAFGYVSLPARISADSAEREMAEARKELARFAAGEGYALAGIFADRRERTENGLYTLLEALRRRQAIAVVAPSLSDLQCIGCLAGASVQTAARYLRARLITLDGAHRPEPHDPPIPKTKTATGTAHDRYRASAAATPKGRR